MYIHIYTLNIKQCAIYYHQTRNPFKQLSSNDLRQCNPSNHDLIHQSYCVYRHFGSSQYAVSNNPPDP